MKNYYPPSKQNSLKHFTRIKTQSDEIGIIEIQKQKERITNPFQRGIGKKD